MVKVSKLRQVSICKDTMLDTGSIDNSTTESDSKENTTSNSVINEEEDGV